MADKYFKYPSTLHLPWTQHVTTDDKVAQSVKQFEGKNVVVTEKLDGENTSMYRDHIHARSMDWEYHPSRTWAKRLHGSIKHDIPEGWRIVGENVYAKHSIHYKSLSDYLYVFAIFNEGNVCLSWNETEAWCKIFGLKTVPVLYRGTWYEEKIKALFTGVSRFGGEQEGYVVRNAGSFNFNDYADNVAKFVRKNHIQTDKFWKTQPVVKNILERFDDD